MSDNQSLLSIAQSYHPLIQSRTKSLSHFYLYGIDIQDTTNVVLLSGGELSKIKTIYELIEDPALSSYMAIYDILVFVSHGWALHSDSQDFGTDMAPADSKDRIRVRLANYLFVSEHQMISSVIPNPDSTESEVQWAEDQTHGTLQDAIMNLY